MAKIKIKSKLIGEEIVSFEGKGILKDNEIIFNENGVKTKIKTFDDKVIIERESDYFLKMEFIRSKKTMAAYNMYDNTYYFDIFTNTLNVEAGVIHIEYILVRDVNERVNFIYNVDYSIDTQL